MYGYKLLLYILILIRETSLCNIRICLTWSVNEKTLTLRCKVDQLRFKVKIVNQFHNALGYCLHPVPVPHCFPFYKNSSITQNASTNVTSLIVEGLINTKINGQWSCVHGTNLDAAIVNVTVRNFKETGYSVPAFGCLLWTNVPFIITIILMRCILWFVEYKQERQEIAQWCVPLCSCACITKFSNENYPPFVLIFVKITLMIFCSIVLFIVPLLIGTNDEHGRCTGFFKVFLLMIGISFGILITLILLSKGKYPQIAKGTTEQPNMANEGVEDYENEISIRLQNEIEITEENILL